MSPCALRHSDQKDNKRHFNLPSQCPLETSACVHAYTLYLLTLIKIIHWGNVLTFIKSRAVCCPGCSSWAQKYGEEKPTRQNPRTISSSQDLEENCFCTMWHFMEHIKASTLGRRKAYKQEVSNGAWFGEGQRIVKGFLPELVTFLLTANSPCVVMKNNPGESQILLG